MFPAGSHLGGRRRDGADAAVPTFPDRLGMLANELTMLSKLGAPGAGVEEDGLATVLTAPAKLGMVLAITSKAAGAEGADPAMAVATPANDGMFEAMMLATPARVGYVAAAGRGSSPEGGSQ